MRLNQQKGFTLSEIVRPQLLRGAQTRARFLKGFTLIELLIVVAITSIIAVITIVDSQSGDRILAVDLSAQKIASALREAQNDSLGGKTVSGNYPLGGFGVHVKNGDSVYIFADTNASHIYNSGEEQKTIFLEENITLQAGVVDVSFVAPTPNVYLNGSAFSYSPPTEAVITVTSADGSYSKTVKVNYAGSIWVQ